MNRNIAKKLLALSLSTALITGIAFAQEEEAPVNEEPMGAVESTEAAANLMASLSAQPDLSSFAQLLMDAGLEAQLHDGGAYTLFAPTNAALADVEGLDTLGQPELAAVASALVSSGALAPDALATSSTVTTLDGSSYEVVAEGESITVDGVAIDTMSAIVTDNGVIYVLDEVFPGASDIASALPLNPAEELGTDEAAPEAPAPEEPAPEAPEAP